MKRQSQEQWLRDIDARQRNIVFPDTAENEGRFWRNIISGKRRLSIVQIIGIGIMWVAVALPLWELVQWMRVSIVSWLLLSLLAASFVLLAWRTRKALSVSRHDSNSRKR
jgi:hypothetical protein